MRRLVILLYLAFPVFGLSQQTVTIYQRQQPEDWSASFIRAIEAGTRTRYLQEQMRLLESQRKAYEAQLKQAQLEIEQTRARGTARQSQPTAEQVEQATKEAEIDLQIFNAKHPDWRQYETMILHFAQRLEPKRISVQEYLDILYTLAKAYSPTQPAAGKP